MIDQFERIKIEQYIKNLELAGDIDPECKSCQTHFYPHLREGKELYKIFAPRHKASSSCRSGNHNHCTCDSCF